MYGEQDQPGNGTGFLSGWGLQGEPGEDHREPKEPTHPLTNKTQEATMKGMRKTSDAGLGPLIPAVLAPPEVMTQAPQGFIPPPLNPTGARLDTQELAPGVYGLLSSKL